MLPAFSKNNFINKFYFRPGIILSVVFIIFIALFTSLGFWQLERAEEKKQLAEQISLRTSYQPLKIHNGNFELLENPDLEYRFIELDGEYEPEHQFFIDNKKYRGRAGYHVVTPFKIHNSEQRILVNRGWVDSGGNRQVLPNIDTPSETVTLKGQMRLPAGAHFRPGISQPAGKLGGIWLYIDLLFYTQLSDTRLLPYILLLNNDNPYGFVRKWPKFVANTEMHIGYAIQWFAFAFFSLLAYFSLGLKTKDQRLKIKNTRNKLA
jgi:surfeit locus 1 family protein